MPAQFDVVIVGKGLVGTSLALLLRNSRLRIALVDEKPPAVFSDGTMRPISLNYNSYAILKNANITPHLDTHATPINEVHVSEKGSFGMLRLRASDYAVNALGYVVNISDLASTLDKMTATLENVQSLQPAKVTHVNFTQTGATLTLIKDNQPQLLTCKLLVAADGSQSTLRGLMRISCVKEDYNEHALSATVSLHRYHNNIAYERFTEFGTIAMLPMQKLKAGMVWTIPNEKKEELMSLTDENFLEILRQFFGFRLGKLLAVGPRQCFPLCFIKSQDTSRPHAIMLGNAAQTLHPIAAQGFNLGLHDAAELAALLMNSPEDNALQRYEQARLPQQQRTVFLTNFIHALYSSHNPLIQKARRLSLGAAGICPISKRFLVKFGMGLPPNLAKFAQNSD